MLAVVEDGRTHFEVALDTDVAVFDDVGSRTVARDAVRKTLVAVDPSALASAHALLRSVQDVALVALVQHLS